MRVALWRDMTCYVVLWRVDGASPQFPRPLEIGRQINHPRRFSRSCNGEPRVSDKLFIDLSGFTAISADGIYAIAAAVIIVIAFVWWR